jgi:elongation factor 3
VPRAGKTTLLKLLVGDLQPIDGVGEVWKHHNLRVAYIAQHSMHHLEDHVESSPLAYIQDRFYLGRDKELAKLATLALDDGERELMTQRGEIEAVIGRAERGSKLWYEVQKVGRKKDDTIWEPLEFLVKMSPYVMKLVKNYDEKMKAMASGVDIRPLTAEEVKRHLGDFGINEDLAVGKIRRMSGGQKSRLVLAAAMWSKPHIIALDEPTNYCAPRFPWADLPQRADTSPAPLQWTTRRSPR